MAVSLCVLPLLLCTGWCMIHYLNNTLKTHAGARHKIHWYEQWYNCGGQGWELTFILIVVCLSIIEGFVLLATTAHYLVNDPPVHDYIRIMQFVGEAFGGFVGCLMAITVCVAGFHFLLVGYAKCLNLSDKIKEKEEKNV